MLHQLQTLTIFFASRAQRDDRASQGGKAAQFFLNVLQSFMALAMRHLVHGAATLLAPILLILLVNLGNLCPQAHDFILKNSKMIHTIRIYQVS